MKLFILVVLLFFSFVLSSTSSRTKIKTNEIESASLSSSGGYVFPNTTQFPWFNWTLSVETRVELLLQAMNFTERLWMLTYQRPDLPRIGLPAYSWWSEALHGDGK